MKNKNELDYSSLNDVVGISKKILKLVYIAMIIGIIFVATLIIKEWGINTFFVTILRVATPFFIGFIIAWLFNPLVCYLEEKGWKRGLAAAVIYLAFVVAIFIFFGFLIPTLYSQINELISSFPNIYNSIRIWLTNIFNNLENLEYVDVNTIEIKIFSFFDSLTTNVTTNLPTVIVSGVGKVFSGVGTFAISLIIGLYLLFDFNNVTDHFMKLIPKDYKFEVRTLIDQIGVELRKYVKGTLLVASMVFVCDSVGFIFAGLKAPILFGLFCGITDLIPYIGPYLGGAAAVIVGFSQGPVNGIITLIVAIVVQLIENYVLQPVVMSKTMKLHPVTIIIGLLIFGHFFGIVGMILATPCIALMKIIYHFFAHKYNWFSSDEF